MSALIDNIARASSGIARASAQRRARLSEADAQPVHTRPFRNVAGRWVAPTVMCPHCKSPAGERCKRRTSQDDHPERLSLAETTYAMITKAGLDRSGTLPSIDSGDDGQTQS